MNLLSQLKAEVKEKGKEINDKRQYVIAAEQAWFKASITEKYQCEKCSRSKNLTLDHIIPRDILKSFGIEPEYYFWEENLRVLCRLCNMFKANKLDFSTPKTKELLQKLLENI